jgi:hypothetical protein
MAPAAPVMTEDLVGGTSDANADGVKGSVANRPDDYPPIDPSTIAPLRDGQPDLYHHMPSRSVTFAEAKARGWRFLYEGKPCTYGHLAPRYTSNRRMCVDCVRGKQKEAPIGTRVPTSAADSQNRTRGAKKRLEEAATKRVAEQLLQPDAIEKQFLESYAETRNLELAAKVVRMTRAQIEGRMSYSFVFREAVNELEKRLDIKPTAPAAAVYEWTDEKRARLVEVWVDTGDIATAREAINVTPSEYIRELARNEPFAAEVKAAEPLAERMLEERAFQLALSGNDKLLTKILTAKNPQYKESLKVDMNTNPTTKMSDEQLKAQLLRLFAKHGQKIIDADIVDAEIIEPAQIEDKTDLVGKL